MLNDHNFTSSSQKMPESLASPILNYLITLTS